MPKEITLSTKDSEYVGYINVRFVSEDGSTEKLVENVDVIACQNKLSDSTEKGITFTKYLQQVRTFIYAEYGVFVSINMAYRFNEMVNEIANEVLSGFFIPGQNLPDSTILTPEPSPSQNSSDSMPVLEDSQQKKVSNKSKLESQTPSNSSNNSTDKPTHKKKPSRKSPS